MFVIISKYIQTCCRLLRLLSVTPAAGSPDGFLQWHTLECKHWYRPAAKNPALWEAHLSYNRWQKYVPLSDMKRPIAVLFVPPQQNGWKRRLSNHKASLQPDISQIRKMASAAIHRLYCGKQPDMYGELVRLHLLWLDKSPSAPLPYSNFSAYNSLLFHTVWQTMPHTLIPIILSPAQ